MSTNPASRLPEIPGWKTNALAAVGLSLIAGYTDGYALRHLHTFVSFISGNTTTAATLVGAGMNTLALSFLVAVFGFFAGSFAGNWIATSSLAKPRRTLLLASAFLLLIHTAFLARSSPGWIDVLVLSGAMALLNPSVRKLGREPVNVTFVTGTISKAAAHLAVALRGQHPEDKHLSLAAFEGLLWVSLFFGAVISVPADRLRTFVLLPACAALCMLAAITSE